MTANTFSKYAKYTVKELESYVADPNACVQKLEWTNLVSVLPKYLGNICEGVKACLSQKIGKYDRKVDGIILAFKNTKILSPLSAIRPNGVQIHVKVTSHFYVFRPLEGATLEGTIKYVSKNYLSAVIYRVFNVTIRLQRNKLQEVKQGRTISFIVKSFDIKCDLPFIEGELISTPDAEETGDRVVKKEKSPRKAVPVKTEPSEVVGLKAKKEAVLASPVKQSSAGKAADDSESEDDNDDDMLESSMKTMVSSIQKEMSDATDSASDSAAPKAKAQLKKLEASKTKKPKKETVSTSPAKQSSAEKAAEESESDGDDDKLKLSMKTMLSSLQKEMSDAADSASESAASKVKAQLERLEGCNTKKRKKVSESVKIKEEKTPKQIKLNGHATRGDDTEVPNDDMESTINAILSGIEKEMSDVADSDTGSSKPDVSKVTTPSAENTDKKSKRKKGNDTAPPKKSNKLQKTKQNGHDATMDNIGDDIDDSISALLSSLEREMSDVADSDHGSSNQAKSNPTKSSGNPAETTDKKQKRAKKGDDSAAPNKGNKRKPTKQNGHAAEHDDVEDSIQALLSGLEKEMSETVDKDSVAPGKSDSKPATPSTAKTSSGKKKKKDKLNIDSLEKQLLLKLAAEFAEPETEEPTVVKSEKSPKKPKKKKSKANEDDFEASIMSSILKCAALVDESETKNSPASSPLKKTGKSAARKSVRFDNTITEASFNAFDSSELLEISQLQSPTLSSTLKG